MRELGDAAAKDSRVVVVEKCQTRHKEHLQSRHVELCEDLQREYDKTDYRDLMNTTFALVPAGRSPATYRLGEALSAGAIPVFIHQHFVKPFPGKIPWSTFSFSFPAEESLRIIDTLRAVPVEKLAKMQVKKSRALAVVYSYCSALGSLHSSRIGHHVCFRCSLCRTWSRAGSKTTLSFGAFLTIVLASASCAEVPDTMPGFASRCGRKPRVLTDVEKVGVDVPQGMLRLELISYIP